MTFMILALISSIPKDWRNQCLVLYCLSDEPPKRGILAYAYLGFKVDRFKLALISVRPGFKRLPLIPRTPHGAVSFNSGAVKFVLQHFSYRLAISNLSQDFLSI